MKFNKKAVKKILGEEIISKYHKVKFCLLNIISSVFPIQDEIIFESHPDLADNTFEVFKYLYSIGLNNKMKFTWVVDDPKQYSECGSWADVDFIAIKPQTMIAEIIKYIRCNRAKVTITCNRMIPRYMVNKKQLNIYLDHGSPLKEMKEDGKSLDYSVGYVVTQANFFEPYIIDEYGISKNQIVCAGVPRNDQLFRKYTSISKIIPIEGNHKVVVWVPTFRQKKNSDRCDCSFDFPLGIPIVYDMDSMNRLNAFLKERNLFLIIKPHPAQDLSRVTSVNYTNLKVLTNEVMLKNNIQTNELLAQTDAMITDYSGIYYDYLLLNRPIGITLDDYEEYKAQKGFVFDNPLEILQGVYIKSLDDLFTFLESVYKGIDEKKEMRERIKEITNDYVDSESTRRVCDFILQEIEKRFA